MVAAVAHAVDQLAAAEDPNDAQWLACVFAKAREFVGSCADVQTVPKSIVFARPAIAEFAAEVVDAEFRSKTAAFDHSATHPGRVSSLLRYRAASLFGNDS